MNFDDNQSKGTYWVSLFIDRNTSMYFDSLGIEYIPLELLYRIKVKSITHNIFRIQSDDFIISRFFCIGFKENIVALKN